MWHIIFCRRYNKEVLLSIIPTSDLQRNMVQNSGVDFGINQFVPITSEGH